MRPGQNKRSRGRNGNNPHFNRGGGGGGGGGGGPRMPGRIQSFDSNGPNVKIRGNAYQVFERYVALAREAATSGDRIAAENLYQHAEHYFRIMNAQGDANQHGQPRPTTPADVEMAGGAAAPQDGDGERRDGVEEVRVQPMPPPPTDEEQPPSY